MEKNLNVEIGKKISNARKEKRMSRAALGKILNLHETTIKRYEDATIKTFDIEKLKEFAEALDIPLLSLIGKDKETMIKEFIPMQSNIEDFFGLLANLGLEEEVIRYVFASYSRIKVYDQIRIENGIEKMGNPIDEIGDPYYRIQQEKFALLVDGDSMNNVVDDGMYAIIEKRPVVSNGEIAVMLIDNEVGVLKRFYRVDDMVILRPDSSNPEHKPLTFVGDEINSLKILGRYLGCVSPMENLL